MGIVTGLLVFAVVWWVVIFAILPIGVQRAENPEVGHDPGAPENPQIGRKALITTGITCVIWLVIYAIVESDMLSFREAVQGFWD
ncbi:DUF1467 family protein [Rhodovibrionaceae bacterium A322]